MTEPRLPAHFAGSISEGTLNARHLVPRFCETLSYCWPTHARVEEYRVLGAALQIIADFTRDRAADVADLLGLWECEQMAYLQAGLYDALMEVAPAGTYFGASEGDGASFGFWPLTECPECGHALDEGNVLCYYCTPSSQGNTTDTMDGA